MSGRRSTVRRADLVTMARIEEITGVSQRLLSKWKERGRISPVREDLTVFDWSEVRPIIAERTGNPPDAWTDEEPAR